MKTIIDMNKITNIIAQTNWKQQGKDIFFLFVGVLMYATQHSYYLKKLCREPLPVFQHSFTTQRVFLPVSLSGCSMP